MQPKKGKYGLWYVDGVAFGFGTPEEAFEHARQAVQASQITEDLKTEVEKTEARVRAIEKREQFQFLGYGRFEWAFFKYYWNSFFIILVLVE